MSLAPQTPRKSLNKSYLKVKPSRSDIETFKTNLSHLLDQINEKESEEHHKTLITKFLDNTYYAHKHYINTKGRNDLVIHNDKDAKSTVGVIIETKSPSNKSEMLSVKNLNTKAFQELVWYYLQERITGNNLEVKYLVATNLYEWFIFDAQLFDKAFAQDSGLVKQYKEFKEGRLAGKDTPFFYKNIAEPAITKLLAGESKAGKEIAYTHLDLRDIEKVAKNTDKSDDNKLIALYKLFSPEHLLKLPFKNDSNSLDKGFYAELLHIIGLTEVKDGGKKLIDRKLEGERNEGSILENTIYQLDVLDKLSRVDRPSQFGSTNKERYFNLGLELVITWINRVLFLKLLEAQLITYHKGDKNYSFLNNTKIKNYDDLSNLFFSVLAKQTSERSSQIKELFKNVPYLNSSLFEPTELEHTCFFIAQLQDNKEIPILPSTVLKDNNGKKQSGKLNALQYLFAFLDSYDFSSEGSEEIQEENKTLISASVLGLIFEKINGYKDGSFFTPGFITMYMCRETIRRSVIKKFNDVKGWNCETVIDLHNKINDAKEANQIINSLKICDPAVGSGHFLVSALNELIALKSELGVLSDSNGKSLRYYHIEVSNDELAVTDEDGRLFEYNPQNKESQRVQETLFYEKQTLIENCLFGVDINPNSVKICRLRLWIELLKNAYYKADSNFTELETLPNIDINIKCGNSLISRFRLDVDLSQALKKSKVTIKAYKQAVQNYHHAESKDQKRELEQLILSIKSNFRTEISNNDPKVKRLSAKRGELDNLLNQHALFGLSKAEQKIQDIKARDLEHEVEKLTNEIEEIKSNKIYENSFEWRFEFPETLNDDGSYRGFDILIGNPPYIRQEEISYLKPYLSSQYTTYTGTADIYVFFVERAMDLLRTDGFFSYILPNKWMKGGYGAGLRRYAAKLKTILMVDFGDLPVFEEAITYPSIWVMQKCSSLINEFVATNIDSLEFQEDLSTYVVANQIKVSTDSLTDESWNLVDSSKQKLFTKIKARGIPLSTYVDNRFYRGVLTGFNDAFIIDEKTKARLIEEDPRSAEVIRPFFVGKDIKRYKQPKTEQFILFIPWHFPLHMDKSITGASMKAEREFEEKYPAVFKHLHSFKSGLEGRNKAETGIRYEWYALQRCAASYFEEFDKPKIIIPAIVKSASYGFDYTGAYSNDKTSIIPIEDYYLLGLLNSSVIDYYLKSLASTKQNGYFEYKPVYISQLPIPEVDREQKEKIVDLVKKILEAKKTNNNTEEMERIVDQIVFKIFDLLPDEIESITNNH